jgi:hypothetical protein
MAIERRNPLPPGRYWVDTFEPKRTDFRVWLDKNAEYVHVENRKEYLDPPGTWYLFSVSEPVHWDGPGLPTIATEEIQSHEDTAQKPPPEPSGLEQIEAGIEKAGNFLLIAALAGAAYVGYRILK